MRVFTSRLSQFGHGQMAVILNGTKEVSFTIEKLLDLGRRIPFPLFHLRERIVFVEQQPRS